MSVNKTKLLCLGLGGFGSEIVKKLSVTEKHDHIEYLVMDSSRSNLRNGFPEDKMLLVPNTDGSGQNRGINLPVYREFITGVLPKIEEATITVLVYGTGGGTGSTLGPLLNKALKEEGRNVINCVITSSDTKIRTDNTIKTLMSIAGGSKTEPSFVMIEEESDNITFDELDNAVMSHIIQLGRVVNDLDRLDTSDISSFLNHQRNGLAPGLTMIERFDDLEKLAQMEGAINMISVVSDHNVKLPNIGLVSSYLGEYQGDGSDVHFVSTMKGMDDFKKILDDKLKHYESVHKALPQSNAFATDSTDDDFMVV